MLLRDFNKNRPKRALSLAVAVCAKSINTDRTAKLLDQSLAVRSVLIDLAQTATANDSARLGRFLLKSLKSITPLHFPTVEKAPFAVLKSPDVPSVLVEIGFLSNAEEEAHLQEGAYRAKLALTLQ